jgi:cobalt-zinc-cadmium efflux system membrane fusion protein
VTTDDDTDHEEHYPVPPPGRRIPAAAQGLVLLIGGGILVTALFVVPAVVSLAAPGAADDAPAGAFKPTDQQWAGLRVQRVTAPVLAPQVQAEGRIALDDDYSTQVFSPYSGRVTRVLARAGDVVAAGAPLFAVQSPELAQAQNDLISALATLRTARAQLELATANEARQHQLFLNHGAALKDWQQSRVDLATAQGGIASGEIAVAAVHSRMASLGMSAADIRAVENAPDLEHLPADALVRAPLAGTITQRQINPGQELVGSVASSGAANAVYTIGDLTHIWMIALTRETDAPRFHVGDNARVEVPAYPGRVFEARISYVAPIVDPNTHRVTVRADIANPDLALKPDMLANFDIATGAAAATIAVPDSAIVYEGSDAHVWLADPAHKTLAIRNITVGPTIHGMVAVTRGLSTNDYIVTSGAVFIDRTLSGG